jgi:trimethylamine---corrinoid protein Co-methyltransferase
MNLQGLPGGLYKPLTQKNIETIHEASLLMLQETGIAFEKGLEDTVSLLEQNGAIVDHNKSRFFLPREMVQTNIVKAPRQVLLHGRNKRQCLDLGENRVHLGTGGAAIKILDPNTGEARSTTLRDLYNISKLVDQLNNIHFLVRPCIPTDIDEKDYDINMFYTCLSATDKHVMSGVNDEQGLRDVIELASMVAGSEEKLKKKPFISIITSFAISPLKLCTQSTKIMQEANRYSIPVALSSAPMAGSTSPFTMAGTLAQLHAEQLAGITICQLTNPGAPILYGGIPGRANMATMGYSGGAVEFGMMNAAIHQMAHYIEIPNYNSSGLSDSKLPDAQAAWEKAFTTVLAVMGGSNYIHHAAGMLESMLTIAYEQYVIDDEIIGNACKVLKGINVDAEHLAMETINAVGPGGNYMSSSHTMNHLRTEYFYGNGVTDSKIRDRWEKDGSEDARQRALVIAKKLINLERPPYFLEDIDLAIRNRFKILL